MLHLGFSFFEIKLMLVFKLFFINIKLVIYFKVDFHLFSHNN